MKKPKPQTKTRNFDYPAQTDGSDLAAKVRKQANGLSKSSRGDLLRRGTEVIGT